MIYIAMLKSGRHFNKPKAVETGFKTFRDLFVEDATLANVSGAEVKIVSEVVAEGYILVETDARGIDFLSKSKALISFLPANNIPYRQ